MSRSNKILGHSDHRPAPGQILRHKDKRRVRIFARAWREGMDHPTYEGQAWLSVQPFTRQYDSAGSSFVAPCAENPLWQGWVPADSVSVRVGLVLGPGWTEVKRKESVAT